MASKKFSTWVVLFILMFLFASKVASRKAFGTSELVDASKSALILGLYSVCFIVQKTKVEKIIVL